jgi:MOSC domain-containing protein YiiM
VIYSSEVIRALQQEGHPIDAGTTGENLTISGLDWPALEPGMELQIGPVRLLLTTYASPCEIIRHSFTDKNFRRISQRKHPGWSRLCARVLSMGTISVGDPVEVVEVVPPHAAEIRSPRAGAAL